jgi:hypothetical protein
VRPAAGSEEIVSGGASTGGGSGVGGRPSLTVRTSIDKTGSLLSPSRPTHQPSQSSKLNPPHLSPGPGASGGFGSGVGGSAHSTPDGGNRAAANNFPPVSMFIAFHQDTFLPAHTTVDIISAAPSISNSSTTTLNSVVASVIGMKNGGRFRNAAMEALLDSLGTDNTSSDLEETHLTSALTSQVPPVVALALLNFMFLPLLGDAFALKRFDLAVNGEQSSHVVVYDTCLHQ